jgi:glucose-6-phosphate isomerase
LDLIRIDTSAILARPAYGERGVDEALYAAECKAVHEWIDAQESLHDAAQCELALDAAEEWASSVAGRYSDVVVLGVGDAARAASALRTALVSPFQGAHAPRLSVLDDDDPDLVGEFLDACDPATTLVQVVSRSGATPGTLAQWMLVRDRLARALGEEAHKDHVVVGTRDPDGPLAEVARREGYRSFPLGPSDGAQALLSSAAWLGPLLCGVDVRGLLAGAQKAAELVREPGGENPLVLWSAAERCFDRQPMVARTLVAGHRLRGLAALTSRVLDGTSGYQRASEGFDGDGYARLVVVERADHVERLGEVHADLPVVADLAGRTLNELVARDRDEARARLEKGGVPTIVASLPCVTPHVVGQHALLLELVSRARYA